MPKRTNKFQKLIYLIHKQNSRDTKVTESKMLTDRVTGMQREVDIVIEALADDFMVTLGIEVVAHSTRRADIEWINKMYGKHKNLPTEKLILVSESGFTKEAINEAQVNGIETLTFEEAMDLEWTTIVNKLKELFFARSSFTAKECRAVLADKYGQQEPPLVGSDLILYNQSGQALGTLKEICTTAISNRSMTEYLYNHPNRDKANTLEVEIKLPEGCYLLDISNSKIEVKKLRLKGDCNFQIIPIPLEHRTYGKNQVAFGKAESPEGDVLVSVVERDDNKMTCEMTLLDEKKVKKAIVKNDI